MRIPAVDLVYNIGSLCVVRSKHTASVLGVVQRVSFTLVCLHTPMRLTPYVELFCLFDFLDCHSPLQCSSCSDSS